MQSVGNRLKEARKQKGYTLADISARTRINTRNLSAIDDDQVNEIVSPFFYRSFVRQYAGEVGIEYNSLSPAVEMLAADMRQPNLPGQGEHEPVRVAPIQARAKRDLSWVAPAAVFLGAVIVCSGGYAAWKHYKPLLLAQNRSVSSTKKPGPAKPIQEAEAHVPAMPALNPAPAQPVPLKPEPPQVAVDEPLANAPVPAAPEKIHLELAATERTWLSVNTDGKTAYTGILEAAQTKILDGQESAKLRTGNAGGVSIVFNGKPIGVIGPRGTTRTVVFTRTGYEVQPAFETVRTTRIGG